MYDFLSNMCIPFSPMPSILQKFCILHDVFLLQVLEIFVEVQCKTCQFVTRWRWSKTFGSSNLGRGVFACMF
jgi:hypothetical protein